MKSLSISLAKAEPVASQKFVPFPKQEELNASIKEANEANLSGNLALVFQALSRFFRPYRMIVEAVMQGKATEPILTTQFVVRMNEYVRLGLGSNVEIWEKRASQIAEGIRVAEMTSSMLFYTVVGELKTLARNCGIRLPHEVHKTIMGLEAKHLRMFVEADWLEAGFVKFSSKPDFDLYRHSVTQQVVTAPAASKRIESFLDRGELVLAASLMTEGGFLHPHFAMRLIEADPDRGVLGSLSGRFVANWFDSLYAASFDGGNRFIDESIVGRFAEYFAAKISIDCSGYFHDKHKFVSGIRAMGWVIPNRVNRTFDEHKKLMEASFTLTEWKALDFEVRNEHKGQYFLCHKETGESISVFPKAEAEELTPVATTPIAADEAPAGKPKPVRKPRAKKASSEAEG